MNCRRQKRIFRKHTIIDPITPTPTTPQPSEFELFNNTKWNYMDNPLISALNFAASNHTPIEISESFHDSLSFLKEYGNPRYYDHLSKQLVGFDRLLDYVLTPREQPRESIEICIHNREYEIDLWRDVQTQYDVADISSELEKELTLNIDDNDRASSSTSGSLNSHWADDTVPTTRYVKPVDIQLTVAKEAVEVKSTKKDVVIPKPNSNYCHNGDVKVKTSDQKELKIRKRKENVNKDKDNVLNEDVRLKCKSKVRKSKACTSLPTAATLAAGRMTLTRDMRSQHPAGENGTKTQNKTGGTAPGINESKLDAMIKEMLKEQRKKSGNRRRINFEDPAVLELVEKIRKAFLAEKNQDEKFGQTKPQKLQECSCVHKTREDFSDGPLVMLTQRTPKQMTSAFMPEEMSFPNPHELHSPSIDHQALIGHEDLELIAAELKKTFDDCAARVRMAARLPKQRRSRANYSGALLMGATNFEPSSLTSSVLLHGFEPNYVFEMENIGLVAEPLSDDEYRTPRSNVQNNIKQQNPNSARKEAINKYPMELELAQSEYPREDLFNLESTSSSEQMDDSLYQTARTSIANTECEAKIDRR